MFDIGDEEIAAIADTIHRKILTRFQGGKEGYLARSERALAEKFGAKHCLMMNSGTSALNSALVALGIGPGDEVLVSAYTWIATPLAAMLLGALPKLVEINETLTMDPVDLEKKISSRTKAILCVHMANLPCDMDAIMRIADAHGIPVVEDCCQAVGGLYKGKRLGTFGKIGCLSFNNAKNITSAEGGAILTDDFELYDRCRLWHDCGTFVQEYDAPVKVPHFAGHDFRASEIQGAIIWAQLPRLDPGLEGLRQKCHALRDFFEATRTDVKVMPHNDIPSQATFGIQFPTVEAYQEMNKRHPEIKSVLETADRHVFTNWVPLVEKRTYRDDINPFRNSPHGDEYHYDASAAPRTLDILARTCTFYIPWAQDPRETVSFYDEHTR